MGDIAWDRMTTVQWTRLVAAMIERRDLERIPSVLALMAVHGHAEHAEDLRQMMLAGAALAGESDA